MLRFLSALLAALPLLACSTAHRADPSPAIGALTWTIAIHGGAGTLDRTSDPALITAYSNSLSIALAEGKRRAEAGDSATDIAEAVIRILEDDELFNAGRGAALTELGRAELDASIMDGSTLKAGAVTGVTTVKNPISLARKVMEQTRHILLAGDGAEQFATTAGVQRAPNDYFIIPRRQEMLKQFLKENEGKDPSAPRGPHSLNPPRTDTHATKFSTVGCVVRDKAGNLAAATSSGGLTGKKYGRIGGAPIIGSGTYANKTVAISCTGTGEQFMRHVVARSIAARMELAGETVKQAADHLIFKTLDPDDGGLIAVDAAGNVTMPYSSEGMYRGTADSSGAFIVRIWEQ